MAWNEPGDNKNKDPWGNRGNDGPPDLDEAFKNLQKKFSSIFGGGKGGGGSGGSGSSGSNGFFFGLIFIILAVVYVIAGVGIVNEQERVVVLRFGNYHQTVGPGLRWNPPLIDKVFTINKTKVRGWSTSEQMLTQDLNIVDIKLSVQYYIADAQDFVLKVKDPENSLKQATNSALRHVAGTTGMHEILTEGRAKAAIEVQQRLQVYLDSYETGIQIETVNIEDSNPPREVQNAFDDVIKAREDEERFKNEAQAYANGVIQTVRGAAQRIKEEAAAYKSKVVEVAKGEAKRFENLLVEYKKAPQVTRQRLYIDTMQSVLSNTTKVMVDIKNGNNMLYIPLDKIMNESTSKAKGVSSSDIDLIKNQVVDQLRRESNSSTRRRDGR